MSMTTGDWFTVDQADEGTYILSEYRHWEETHCCLFQGKLCHGSGRYDYGDWGVWM